MEVSSCRFSKAIFYPALAVMPGDVSTCAHTHAITPLPVWCHLPTHQDITESSNLPFRTPPPPKFFHTKILMSIRPFHLEPFGVRSLKAGHPLLYLWFLEAVLTSPAAKANCLLVSWPEM